MSRTLPLFPLNTVVFPGMTVPLHIFEERYRTLVEELLEVPDPAQRVFGTVAIREGFEVGDAHGAQSLFRVGCVLQLGEAERNPDGTFEIVAVGRGRLRLSSILTDRPYPAGVVEVLGDDHDDVVAPELVERARSLFERYRGHLSQLHGEDVLTGSLPRDPAYLSWTLAATTLLPLPDRQSLLEADDTHLRLAMITRLLREEMRAMDVVPSLPAVDVARTGWSPN
ncbi:LON peptidase substrate-binding domain-containing protein [Nocardioides jiangxiensis]|uniref:LON peptidase substrate-binding domain-containing protein n=1 Tax=Nocardioides jiangxiensis TaxID=3064524 RepID=A0ABT9B3S6_9ACTN|nr:LON peptidase substrate-binding domain-containing protein [Nocardioides sp. WY-20]MDO7869363.1 LON peptidase substrate-binding domain-containing protein [Nocardioides sp. WY-20]